MPADEAGSSKTPDGSPTLRDRGKKFTPEELKGKSSEELIEMIKGLQGSQEVPTPKKTPAAPTRAPRGQGALRGIQSKLRKLVDALNEFDMWYLVEERDPSKYAPIRKKFQAFLNFMEKHMHSFDRLAGEHNMYITVQCNMLLKNAVQWVSDRIKNESQLESDFENYRNKIPIYVYGVDIPHFIFETVEEDFEEEEDLEDDFYEPSPKQPCIRTSKIENSNLPKNFSNFESSATVPKNKTFHEITKDLVSGMAKFDGSPGSIWPVFWETFHQNVNCIPPSELPSKHKLSALLQATSGLARQEVEAFTALGTEDAYERAVANLDLRFGSKSAQNLLKDKINDVTKKSDHPTHMLEYLMEVNKLYMGLSVVSTDKKKAARTAIKAINKQIESLLLSNFINTLQIPGATKEDYFDENPIEVYDKQRAYLIYEYKDQESKKAPVVEVSKPCTALQLQMKGSTKDGSQPGDKNSKHRNKFQNQSKHQNKNQFRFKSQNNRNNQNRNFKQFGKDKKQGGKAEQQQNQQKKFQRFCLFCSSVEHSSSNCYMTPFQRKETLTRKHLCQNCLKSKDHTVRECPEPHKCNNCPENQLNGPHCKHSHLVCFRKGKKEQLNPKPTDNAVAVQQERA